jgi:carbamoyltransferase
MRVLGIGTEGDGGASIASDGVLLSAINEERICRLKLVKGFPRAAIREALELSGTEVNQLDAVLVASLQDLFVDELEPFDGWFQHWKEGRGLGARVKRWASRLSPLRRHLPFAEAVYYGLLAPTFAHRRRAIRRILKEEFGIRSPIKFLDHHFCHVTSAHFASGMEDALIVSLDGGGDGKSGLICVAKGSQVKEVHAVSAFNSLGNYYAYITHLCGFKAQKHEGKITGLAAYGEPRYLDILRSFVDERSGTIENLAGVVFQEAARRLLRALPQGWTREDLAASIQRHFEEVVVRLVSHWVRETGMSRVAMAGGVFANVRVNEEIHRIPGVDQVFIHPGMADGGLHAGAALAACADGVLDQTMPYHPEPLRDVYLGTPIEESEITEALRASQLQPQELDRPLEEEIAELLAKGYVVARAAGKMEYGPRALGNRSILYQPSDRSVNDWLNTSLKRTEFMPFAPAVMVESLDRCFEHVGGAEHAAEFMTITFHCTPWMRDAMPGVVHLDGTARPQVVRRDRSPEYYRIIEAFEERTRLPAIINTSFNMHEEPIVRSADDAVRAFLQGRLDYLALGDCLIQHPEGITRPLTPAPVQRERVEVARS